MAKKNITIEDLARMVQNGFQETSKKEEVNKRFDAVDDRFNAVDKRLEKIEKLMLVDHNRRIEKLEEEVKELKGLLAM